MVALQLASWASAELCVDEACMAGDEISALQMHAGRSASSPEKRGDNILTKGASYFASCKSAGHGEKTFFMEIGSLHGNSYSFSATNFAEDGSFSEHFTGGFENFAINKGTQEFSADVTFQGHPWKGKLTGKEWEGNIKMDNGHIYTLQVVVSAGGGKVVQASGAPTLRSADIGGNVAYVAEVRGRGGKRSAFSMVVSKLQGATHNFVVTGLSSDAHTQQYGGSIINFVFNPVDQSFKGDITFDSLPWKGVLFGSNYEGMITMANGYSFDVSVRPFGHIVHIADAPAGAAYFANVLSGSPSKTAFSFAIGPKKGSTYDFVASSFAGVNQLHKGEFRNFVIDGVTQKFSADVRFHALSWKGRLTGQDWKGQIKMDNDYTYTIVAFLPSEAMMEPAKRLDAAAAKASAAPVAYRGSCRSGGARTADFSLEVSYKNGSSYSFAAAGFQPNGVTQGFLGHLRDFEFDKSDESFKADVMFDYPQWKGKLQGKQWKGSIVMESGFTYEVAFKPSS